MTYASKIVHYPQQVPQAYQEKFAFIDDLDNRRVYHAMVNFLDDQLLNITTTMKVRTMLLLLLLLIGNTINTRIESTRCTRKIM